MATKESNQIEKPSTSKVSIFGTMPTDSIFNPYPPYNLRNDCQIGQWKRGEDDYKGQSLEISIIKARNFYGELGMSRNNWLQIWFIASPTETKLPKNTVCVTYVKTRSLDDLSGKLIDLMTNGKDPGEMIWTASFAKHSGDMGNYFSVTWNYRDREGDDEQKQLEQIYEFIKSEPELKDASRPETLICIDNMSAEEMNSLNATIDAIKEANAEKAKK